MTKYERARILGTRALQIRCVVALAIVSRLTGPPRTA
jgi:DNA-directed RNA polymerase subunit K/omega